MAQVNLDTATRLDIICRKGDSFELSVDFGEGVDSIMANWKMQVASSDTASTPALTVEGAVASGTGFSIASNSDSVANAKLTIKVSSTTMAGLTSGLYVYDLQNDSDTAGVSGGTVKTYLYGTFKVNEDVTNPGVA